jgi:pyrroloquinoline quinone biosynthesis protein B
VHIRVLGSAAGGGFPQWNCGCANCRGVRDGSIRATPRTQESVAVSSDGESWFLLHASPEVRQQIESFAPLQPRAPRQTPIAAIVLGDGDLDHCLGLLSLRESQALFVYATERVRRGFTDNNVLYKTLERFPGQVTWRALALGEEMPLVGVGERPSGLTLRTLSVPGKVPLHLHDALAPSAEDNIGLVIRELATGRTLAWFPAVAAATPELLAAIGEADCLFFDGTFWSEDELIALGLATRRAAQMGHWPIGGAQGSLQTLAQLPIKRRIFIHINNTNPILRDDSAERRAVEAAGLEVAYDGMELRL